MLWKLSVTSHNQCLLAMHEHMLASVVQRLVTNAEEVAFNDDSLPSGKSEEMVLNWHLSRMVKHSSLSAFQRFVQQVFDGFAVKYMASAVALLLYAAPLYFRDPSLRGTQADITQDYIRAMRLLQNTSRQVHHQLIANTHIVSVRIWRLL